MQNSDHVRNDNGHSFSHPGKYIFNRLTLASHDVTPPQGLVLPTQSVQNQIHELAKTLPPPRKQNTACDACRFALHASDRRL
jgi:hypothetical protein